MRSELADLHARLGITFVYVTHDQVEAMTMSDRISMMDSGRILQLGTPAELYEHPQNVKVASFIGSPAINLLPARVLTPVDQRGGYRRGARAGEKGLVNLTKLVPLVGGPIGAAVDGVSCKTIAGYAMRTFTPIVPRIVPRTMHAEVVPGEASGEVVQGEIVPD